MIPESGSERDIFLGVAALAAAVGLAHLDSLVSARRTRREDAGMCSMPSSL
jgi:hypothetical protein